MIIWRDTTESICNACYHRGKLNWPTINAYYKQTSTTTVTWDVIYTIAYTYSEPSYHNLTKWNTCKHVAFSTAGKRMYQSGKELSRDNYALKTIHNSSKLSAYVYIYIITILIIVIYIYILNWCDVITIYIYKQNTLWRNSPWNS